MEYITVEKIKAILDDFEKLVVNPANHFYVNPKTFDRLYAYLAEPKEPVFFEPINGIAILADEVVEENQCLYCSARQFEIYKSLKTSKWIQPGNDLLKLAAILYENERKTANFTSPSRFSSLPFLH